MKIHKVTVKTSKNKHLPDPDRDGYNGDILHTDNEIRCFKGLLKEVKKVPGELAEIGVFRGFAARIIRREIPDRPLHLFDTFRGFIKKYDHPVDAIYEVGDLSASVDTVKQLLKGEEDIHYHVGDIARTRKAIKDKKFAFVHIDVDVSDPTKAALEYFYPRINKGGIILIDDYCNGHPGLQRVVHEFCKKNNLELQRGAGRYYYVKHH
jgi:hypothetical protein